MIQKGVRDSDDSLMILNESSSSEIFNTIISQLRVAKGGSQQSRFQAHLAGDINRRLYFPFGYRIRFTRISGQTKSVRSLASCRRLFGLAESSNI